MLWHKELDEDIEKVIDKKSCYYGESFSTPGLKSFLPWVDGTFVYPTEWYWNKGVLKNNKDSDMEFLYLHVMVWKGGTCRFFGGGQWERLRKIVHVDYKEAPNGWKINKRGIFKIEGTSQERLLQEKSTSILLRQAFLMKKILSIPFMYGIYTKIENFKIRIRVARFLFKKFITKKKRSIFYILQLSKNRKS
jgi:hypothetical protein